MYPIRRVFHPEIYQGQHKKSNYFEGWYFKSINQDRSQSLAVIPGVAMNRSGEKHAFIQLIHAQTGRCRYFHFPFTAFQASRKSFDVTIGLNEFSRHHLFLDIDQEEGQVSGRLDFDSIVPYPTSFRHPGIMGPYSFVPRMECYHGILNISHHIRGRLVVDGAVFDFDGGRGYLEKDYGRSFPTNWVWLQANHFSRPGLAFMFSRAAIPWLGSSFQGLIAFLAVDGKLYRFATYNRTQLRDYRIDHTNLTVEAVLENRHGLLSFKARQHGGGILRAPKNGQMDRLIRESITATLELTWQAPDGRTRLTDTSDQVGMEISEPDEVISHES